MGWGWRTSCKSIMFCCNFFRNFFRTEMFTPVQNSVFEKKIVKKKTQVEKNNTTVVTSVGQTVYLYCGVHNLGERAVRNKFLQINIVWTIYHEVICFPWVVQSDTSKVLNFPVLSFTPSSSSLNCQTEHFGHFWRLALFYNAKILAAPSSQSQSVSDVKLLKIHFQVSWIRSRDLTILTIGLVRYTRDPR